VWRNTLVTPAELAHAAPATSTTTSLPQPQLPRRSPRVAQAAPAPAAAAHGKHSGKKRDSGGSSSANAAAASAAPAIQPHGKRDVRMLHCGEPWLVVLGIRFVTSALCVFSVHKSHDCSILHLLSLTVSLLRSTLSTRGCTRMRRSISFHDQ
jgi:hypothetical protein